jgi:hypothetical protein
MSGPTWYPLTVFSALTADTKNIFAINEWKWPWSQGPSGLPTFQLSSMCAYTSPTLDFDVYAHKKSLGRMRFGGWWGDRGTALSVWVLSGRLMFWRGAQGCYRRRRMPKLLRQQEGGRKAGMGILAPGYLCSDLVKLPWTVEQPSCVYTVMIFQVCS